MLDAPAFAQPPVVPAELEDRIPPQHVQQAEQPGNHLCDNRGIGRPRHPHLEGNDEQQIQPHIDKGGKNEKIQGRPAVSQRPQHARHQIIENRGAAARENDDNIGVSIRINVRRSIHKPQQRVGQQHADGGEDHRHARADVKGHGHRLPQPVLVVRAEALGRDHGKAARQADNEAQYQKRDRPGGAHRRQSAGADEASHHHGVHHVIKLLKDISHKQRQGKG